MKLLKKTKKITAKDSKKLFNQLIQNGLPQTAAQNIIKFYET